MILLKVGHFEFCGEFETAKAPRSVAWLRARLPLASTALHARWSGEAGWSRLGQVPSLGAENTLAVPAPGQLLLYAGDVSEPELLLPYGVCRFACSRGGLAGNHVITLHAGSESLLQMGLELLHRGEQPLQLTEPA